MNIADNFYPSYIAKLLAHDAGLLESPHVVNWLPTDEVINLIQFQQMSLVASFEDCLTIYYGQDLTEKQIKNLEVIHCVTPKLLPGELFQAAMENIAKESEKSKPNTQYMVSNLHMAIDQLGKRAKT